MTHLIRDKGRAESQLRSPLQGVVVPQPPREQKCSLSWCSRVQGSPSHDDHKHHSMSGAGLTFLSYCNAFKAKSGKCDKVKT